MIDLHMHSTFSDGSFTPTELVEMAAGIGLKTIALTDHDTVDGVDEFMQAGERLGVDTVTGLEFSAEHSPGTMHILGYHVDIENAALCSRLEWVREKRSNRNVVILEKLNAQGLELTWEEIAACAGSDLVGRPHFAQAMIARGYCSDKQEVFDKYLAKGKSAYVDRARQDPSECIDLIRGAGGVAVLAHPLTLKLTNTKLRKKLGELVDMGLRGLECYYAKFNPREHEQMLLLAEEFDLVVTGGTDFHGADSPDIRMGFGFGGLDIPDQLAHDLHACAARIAG